MIQDRVDKVIDVLRRFEPREGYFLAFSGGKDSICCYYLLKLSGCKFEAHYSITTVDEPFVKPFIRKYYPDVIFDHPEISMYNLIVKKGILPGRLARYCCEFLKEYSGKGRLVITGVRNAESFNRAKRRMFELDNRKKMQGKAYLNPIVTWEEDDVWEFIMHYRKEFKIQIPDYYANDCRSARGGCVGCPLGGVNHQKKEFKKYPRYKNAYMKAITRAKANGRFKLFDDAEQVFGWWLSDMSVENYKALCKLQKARRISTQEDLQNFKKYNHIYKEGDKVKTPRGIMIVVTQYSKFKMEDGSWMPQYICCPMNKKGLPDKRRLRSLINKTENTFSEKDLTLIVDNNEQTSRQQTEPGLQEEMP